MIKSDEEEHTKDSNETKDTSIENEDSKASRFL